jgi:centrosomal protein CEP104
MADSQVTQQPGLRSVKERVLPRDPPLSCSLLWPHRFAQWPQEVVLKLEHPSKIQQIQMLSHEYKVCWQMGSMQASLLPYSEGCGTHNCTHHCTQIASKVEVFVACPKPGEETSKAPFSRLGYLSFDSNERSNYQARELKTVHVNTQAYFVRLVVHRCHMNKLNLYSQVGRRELTGQDHVCRKLPAGPL